MALFLSFALFCAYFDVSSPWSSPNDLLVPLTGQIRQLTGQ